VFCQITVTKRKDKRGVDLISDALPFGRLWYEDASAAVDYAKHSSRSHDALIRVYDAAGLGLSTQSNDKLISNLGNDGNFSSPLP